MTAHPESPVVRIEASPRCIGEMLALFGPALPPVDTSRVCIAQNETVRDGEVLVHRADRSTAVVAL
ncbi:MAG: hypothetical protein OEW11_11180 [Nitrospirota bacterium]|nr:hypothetical protein [Nitrospirota bacterium]